MSALSAVPVPPGHLGRYLAVLAVLGESAGHDLRVTVAGMAPDDMRTFLAALAERPFPVALGLARTAVELAMPVRT